MSPGTAPRRSRTAIRRSVAPLPTTRYSGVSIMAPAWTARGCIPRLAGVSQPCCTAPTNDRCRRTPAVYIDCALGWERRDHCEAHRCQSDAIRDKSKPCCWGERQSPEWGVATTSTAARPANEILRPELLSVPITTIRAGCGAALTVLIAVPTVEAGAADEGAVELARMLAAGHRAIVVSSGGRLEQNSRLRRRDWCGSTWRAAIRWSSRATRSRSDVSILQHHCAVVHALARAPAWSALLPPPA